MPQEVVLKTGNTITDNKPEHKNLVAGDLYLEQLKMILLYQMSRSRRDRVCSTLDVEQQLVHQSDLWSSLSLLT